MTKKEETVTVEMTKEQKEKVVALLAKDKEKSEPVPQETIYLRFEHSRNNVKYSGTVTVPADLASSLAVADQKAFESRIRENQGGDHLVEIMGRGVTKVIR